MSFAAFSHSLPLQERWTFRQGTAVMGHFEPAHNSWARALRRDIDAQQESLCYTSSSARDLQKLYRALNVL